MSEKQGNQNWRTPPDFWQWLQKHYGPFDHDFAATATDSLCASYSTDCLGADIPQGRVFCNPPWRLSAALARRLTSRFHSHGSFIMLCQNATGDVWWADIAPYCETVILTPRVAYVDPTGSRRKSPNRGSILLAWGGPYVPGLIRSERWK